MSGVTPEEAGLALAEASSGGWVTARAYPAGALERWPDLAAVLYAVDDLNAVAWVADPGGFDLQVTSPDGRAVRFRARKPAAAPGTAKESP